MDPAPDTRYGGLHLRLAAGAIDLLLSQALYFLLIIVHAMWSGLLDISRIDRPIAPWISAVVTWAYFVGFESSSRSATPGKMLLRLVVVDSRGRRISFAHASVRFLCKVVSAATVVGVLAIPFNRRRRGLHDVLAATLVVEGRTATVVSGEGGRGTPEAAAASRRQWRLVAWPVAAVALLLLLGTWQFSAWGREHDAQTACLRSLQDDLARAHAAQRKWESFLTEVGRLEKELGVVSRMLPRRLNVDGFQAAFVEELASRGIRVHVLGVRSFRRGRLFRAEIQTEMAGDATSIAEALKGSCCDGRVTTWKGSFTDAGVRGALSIYATPVSQDPPPVCAPRRSDLWLWPFSARAKALANEIERARAELSGFSAIVADVHRYETIKTDLERRIELVNQLKGSRPNGDRDEPEVPVANDQGGAVRS